MLKLPSMEQVLQDATATFKRFPLVLIVAAAGTIAALILVDRTNRNQPSALNNVMLAAGLGISLMFGLALATEKRKQKWLIQALGLLILVGYSLAVPPDLFKAPLVHLIRFQMLLIATHMFTAVAPFLRQGSLNGFWQYNKTLFFRFLTSALFSGVLFAGLAIALVALDKLFSVDIRGIRYLQLWILISGLFNTWFFLAGIPEDMQSLEQVQEYPKGLKVFAQYILLPLVLIYFVILYAYVGKILIQWNWPKGWVSGLILGFSGSGLFALLLLFPIRELPGQLWIKKAWRLFFLVIIPLIPVLFLAAWQRVSQYGITESRYVLLGCAVWLAMAALYFNLSKAKSIRFIPISLCLTSLMISFGPWGAFAVSEKSQVARLEEILIRNEILAGSKVQKAPSAVPYADAKQISSILDYLQSIHGYERIQPWFAKNLNTDSGYLGSNYLPADSVTSFMGVKFVSRREHSASKMQELNIRRNVPIDVAGFDRILWGQSLDRVRGCDTIADPEALLIVSKTMDTLKFVTLQDGKHTDSVQMNPREFIDKLLEGHSESLSETLPPESLSIAAENKRIRIKVIIDGVSTFYRPDSTGVLTCSYDLLYSVRPQ